MVPRLSKTNSHMRPKYKQKKNSEWKPDFRIRLHIKHADILKSIVVWSPFGNGLFQGYAYRAVEQVDGRQLL